MYGATPNTVFQDVQTVPRGPWFKETMVMDDGLEYFYKFVDSEGQQKFLLSNNLKWQDREKLDKLYKSVNRSMKLTSYGSLYLTFEIVSRCTKLRKMGLGIKFLAGLFTYTIVQGVSYNYLAHQYYAPLFAAFYKKYELILYFITKMSIFSLL